MLYQTKVIDGIIANRDFAYDLDSNNGTNYQESLNISSKASINVPAFFVTGNHQHNSEDTLKLYYETFEQYGADKKLANGITMGPPFFATFDPYGNIYKNQQSNSHIRKESIGGAAVQGFTEALNNGSKLNKVIIPISHYSLKCSAPAKNCQNDTIILKSYFDIMFRYNLPFYIGAHYHTYERVYPYCPTVHLTSNQLRIIFIRTSIALFQQSKELLEMMIKLSKPTLRLRIILQNQASTRLDQD